LIDHGKRPVVWLHATAAMWPHAWAFADMVSEGESFTFDKPEAPDWVDMWGQVATSTQAPAAQEGGAWLQSIGRAQKYGFVPAFLNYIRFFDRPEYSAAVRAMYAVLGVLDIVPTDKQFWFADVKRAFGIGEPDVRFLGFWEQSIASTSAPQVRISVYTRLASALILVSNLGAQDFVGRVQVDLDALGLSSADVEFVDAESVNGSPLPFLSSELQLTIPRHDIRLILARIADSSQA
jgi:hypothetical protein